MAKGEPRLTLHTLGDVKDLDDPAKVQQFWEGILHGHISQIGLEQPRLKPLISVVTHATNLKCVSVVVQTAVQDPDFAAEFHAYYGRIFQDVPRQCKRLHCFSKRWRRKGDVLRFVDAAGDLDYLGFITLRPVKANPVGATILRPPKDGSHFLLSKDTFDVHLAGKTFKVEGTPFLQQDNAVGACAQAAIWMALRTLRKREGAAAHDLAQITSSATRFFLNGRTLPNREGLVIQQMMEAVRSAGYSATLLSFREPGGRPRTALLPKIKTSLYPYIESGIPVILAMHTQQLGGHAVVLIGHGWHQQPLFCALTAIVRGNQHIYVRNSADWASPFFMHNDNTGPYLQIPDTGDKGSYTLDKVCYAIPLLPGDVYMTAEEAEQVAFRLISHAAGDELLDNKKYVFRTYLQERYKFREEAKASGMTTALKRQYRLMRLPRRLWVTEVNLQDAYEQSDAGKGQRVGEVLVDPTGDPAQAPFLSIHLPDVLINRDPNTGKIEATRVADDKPYSPLVRKPAS